jgi:uncharacterized protein DUF6879
VTSEEFGQLFGTFTRNAFRLETLSRYDVPAEAAALRDFLAGAPKPSPDPDDLAWQANIRAHAVAGRDMQRVHLIRGPLTDYLRFEIEWGYPDNAAAGEDIRILHVAEGELPDLGDVDFWLFDDSTLVLMRYDEQGCWLGADLADPAVLPEYRRRRDQALALAVPLNEYLSEVRAP